MPSVCPECPTCGSELLLYSQEGCETECNRCGMYSFDDLVSPRRGLGGIDRVMEQMFPNSLPALEGETEETRRERIQTIRAMTKEALVEKYGDQADYHARDMLIVMWIGQRTEEMIDDGAISDIDEDEEEEDEGMSESTVEPDEQDLIEDDDSE